MNTHRNNEFTSHGIAGNGSTLIKKSCLFVIVLVLLSCEREAGVRDSENIDLLTYTALVQSSEEGRKVAPFFLWLVRLQEKIMVKTGSYSEEVIMISDPFYALNYKQNKAQDNDNYYAFYEQARNKGVSARMYVVVEPNTQESHGIELGKLLEDFDSNVPLLDMMSIRYAKKVVVSPLLSVLAPTFYEEVKKVREDYDIPIHHISYDALLFDEQYLTVDYSLAMSTLGKRVVEVAHERDTSAPSIALILDNGQAGTLKRRFQYFLQAVYQEDPTIKVTQLWSDKKYFREGAGAREIKSISSSSVVVLDAGNYTLASISEYVTKHVSTPNVWKNRFFVVQDLGLDYFDYRIPLAGMVSVPHSFIFEKKHYTSAVFSRIEKKDN